MTAWIPSHVMLIEGKVPYFKWIWIACVLVHILPLLVFSMICIRRVTESWCTAVKVVARCPAILILSIFSHFTIGSKDTVFCCCYSICCKERLPQGKLAVSKTLTFINIFISILTYMLIYCVYFWLLGVMFWTLLYLAACVITAGWILTVGVFWLPWFGAMCCCPLYIWCYQLSISEWDISNDIVP